MRALIQRVRRASVTVDGDVIADIEAGLLVLLGITHEDDEAIADRLADKVATLRIFEDAARPEQAEPLYERFRARLNAQGGRFGAHMEVELINDGPVTLLLELP